MNNINNDNNREQEIKEAVAHYEALLRSQIERSDRIKNGEAPTDFSSKEQISIGFIGGDGIGPGLVRETERVMAELLKDELSLGKLVFKDIEGLTIENRMACNKAVPDDVLAEIKACDVFVKGPTTTPHGGSMGSANVTLRRELDLFANVRPVSIPEMGIDWTFFRENTEGEYVLGSEGIDIDDTLAMDFKCTTIPGTERIARKAFDFAVANGKTEMAVVTKANILKKTDGLFSQICNKVAADYPTINVSEWYIDIMTANLVNEDIRSRFQVFVLPNLYGDIITDEAAQLQGGVGTAGSANIGDRYAMFEAIHGSAPRLMEEGLGEYADPRSVMSAGVMLLSHIGLQEKSDCFKAAIAKASLKGEATGSKDNLTTAQFADLVLAEL